MAWLDLVVTATVGRQSREAELEEKGCRAPPILCRTNSQPWGRLILLGDPWQNLFKCFLR